MKTNDKNRNFWSISVIACLVVMFLLPSTLYGVPKAYKQLLYKSDIYAGVNWELMSSSPLIDKADGVADDTMTDVAGNPRKVGNHVDIGAYEHQTVVGITSVETLKNTFYPNPASDQITFGGLVESIEVYTLCGTLLLSATHVSVVSLSEIPQGSYLVKYTDLQGQKVTQVLIKQ